ncbi:MULTISPECIES: alpha/beta fold hydrolase [Corallococcus]|uniref:lipase family alpha/beta hydrolase n=1 Tax=Corallococcus TaxID=83461 RepID=UPI00117C5B57|nr:MULTISPECIES: alpha/beta fold hydrolase [Corallococcus]NBD11683.1 alpha/beta fold hydrolase [Corallococcus silvisoli]TSC23656.1 alpha/beta fold hydrolase [Corallococcus sp. Z5C101001]
MAQITRPSSLTSPPQTRVAPEASLRPNAAQGPKALVVSDGFTADAPAGAQRGPELSQVNSLRLPIPWPGRGEADKIGWIQKAYPPARDATPEFQKLNQAVRAGQNVLPPEAKDCVFLAVGGLLSEAAPKELYFDKNLDALKAQGLQVGRVPVDTDMGVEHNAAIVRQAVLEAAKNGKQVVLMGHSKGGLDSAAALAMYPELKDHVRALVTIQSPYGGSPMAQDLLDNPLVRYGVGGAIEALGGSIQAGEDLTYDSRKKFLAEHPMPAGIPAVCMASTTANPTSPLFAAEEYMQQRYGVKSDGLVLPQDAFIPGSKSVTLQGLDHLDSTGTTLNPFKPYHPEDLTLSLVAMALNMPKGG